MLISMRNRYKENLFSFDGCKIYGKRYIRVKFHPEFVSLGYYLGSIFLYNFFFNLF